MLAQLSLWLCLVPSVAQVEAASRLCTACGMCCNGVLFHIVRLQPRDSARELEALGMRINRKKREPYFRQPCKFLNQCKCTIYDARPTRCRLFDCQQIKQVADGTIDEAQALVVIETAKTLVADIEALLVSLGNTATQLPLLERCETVLGELATSETSGQVDVLTEQVSALSSLLNRQFRTQLAASVRNTPNKE